GRDSLDSPAEVTATKPRRRRTGPMLVIASVVVLAVVALVLRGFVLTGHESRADKDEVGSSQRDHDKEEGEEEEDGGPTGPADYLTQKFTSGHDVKRSQIKRALAQARALKRSGGTWGQVGPTNVGGRITDLVVDPKHPDTSYVAVSGGGIW